MPSLRLSVFVVCLWACTAGAVQAQADSWSEPQAITAVGEKISTPVAGLGPNGYAVVVWSPPVRDMPTGGSSPTQSDVGIIVRVRASYGAGFGSPVKIGGPGSSGANLAVGSRGHTALSWVSRSGKTMAAFRGPSGAWSKPKAISNASFWGVNLDVGSDGTTVAAGVRLVKGHKSVFAAVRMPGKRKFQAWRRIDLGVPGIGNYISVAAGKNGRASVAWSGKCPMFDPAGREPARVAEADGRSGFARSRPVPGTKCPTSGIQIERDVFGNSYLLVGGSAGTHQTVRLSTKRLKGWFRPSKVLNRKSVSAVSGILTISRTGVASVIWTDLSEQPGGAMRPLSVSLSQTTRRSAPTPPVILPVDPSTVYLLGAAALGRSGIQILWQDLTDFSLVSARFAGGSLGPSKLVGQPSTTESIAPAQIVSSGSSAMIAWGEASLSGGSITDLMVADCPRC